MNDSCLFSYFFCAILEVYLRNIGIRKAVAALVIKNTIITISNTQIKLAKIQQKPIKSIPKIMNCSFINFSIYLVEIMNITVNRIKLKAIKVEKNMGSKKSDQ